MINDILIQSFLSLVQTHSVSETSRKLYLSQQAVSKHLSRLEAELDCLLFHRVRGSSLILTDAGRIYYEAFSNMQQILTDAHERVKQIEIENDRRLIIGYLHLFDSKWMLNHFFNQFAVLNPDVSINLKIVSDASPMEQLMDGQLDAVFCFLDEPVVSDLIAYYAIDKLQDLLIVANDHPLVTENCNYMAFQNEPIFYTPRDFTTKVRKERVLRKIGFPTNKLIETDGILQSLAAVETCQGVTFATERCRLLEDKNFRTYPCNNYTELILAYLSKNPKQALQRFVRFTMEQSV